MSKQSDTDSSQQKSELFDTFASKVVLDEQRGFLRQFIEFSAGPIIEQAFKDYADEVLLNQALEFRRQKLSERYGLRWHKAIWHKKMVRQGRERRARVAKRRQERAQSLQQSNVEDDVAAFRSTMRSSMAGPGPENGEMQQFTDTAPQAIGVRRSLPANASTQFNGYSSIGTQTDDTLEEILEPPKRKKHKRSKTQPDAISGMLVYPWELSLLPAEQGVELECS